MNNIKTKQGKNKSWKTEKVDHHKIIMLEGFSSNGLQIRSQRIFFERIACLKIIFQHFLKNVYYRSFCVFSNLKNYINLLFWSVGTMLERFFEAKTFIFHVPKPIQVPTIIHFGYFRHTVDPQGPFGGCESKVAYKFSKKYPRRL